MKGLQFSGKWIGYLMKLAELGFSFVIFHELSGFGEGKIWDIFKPRGRSYTSPVNHKQGHTVMKNMYQG
jgi:hypothetical protein